MKKSDHLDNGVAISAQLVERGVQLKAQSRAVSGIDRLLGNLSELVNAPLERRNARIRAEQDVIEALGAAAVARIQDDTEFAKQIIETKIHRAAREYFNKEAVVAAAIEDLSVRPPTADQAASGPDVLDQSFLNRFERYAEEAEDDATQEKWARVLAGEIRNPGRFSVKTMRLVDEISTATAKLFQELCKHRIGNSIPKYLSGELDFNTKTALENAGLLIPSDGDTVRVFKKLKSNRGEEIYLAAFGARAIGLPAGVNVPTGNYGIDLASVNSEIGCPIYLLTADGEAVSSLADDEQDSAWESLVSKVANFLTGIEIREFIHQGENWIPVAARTSPETKDAL